jgi:hypothetical protein
MSISTCLGDKMRRNPNLCPPISHKYNQFVKNKQIHFEKRDRDVTIHIAQAILCSKCGDVIWPEYPSKIKNYDLESIVNVEIADHMKKENKRKK